MSPPSALSTLSLCLVASSTVGRRRIESVLRESAKTGPTPDARRLMPDTWPRARLQAPRPPAGAFTFRRTMSCETLKFSQSSRRRSAGIRPDEHESARGSIPQLTRRSRRDSRVPIGPPSVDERRGMTSRPVADLPGRSRRFPAPRGASTSAPNDRPPKSPVVAADVANPAVEQARHGPSRRLSTAVTGGHLNGLSWSA